MIDQSRRTLLKGLGYSSALAIAGAPAIALAQSNTQPFAADLANFDIHVLPTQHAETKSLRLFNHTDSNVVIDSIAQDGENGLLAIKMNKPGQVSLTSTTLTPGEFHEFTVAANHGNLTQIMPSADELPITIFDSVAA